MIFMNICNQWCGVRFSIQLRLTIPTPDNNFFDSDSRLRLTPSFFQLQLLTSNSNPDVFLKTPFNSDSWLRLQLNFHVFVRTNVFTYNCMYNIKYVQTEFRVRKYYFCGEYYNKQCQVSSLLNFKSILPFISNPTPDCVSLL